MKHIMITEPDRLYTLLTNALDVFRDVGFGQVSYGFFHGGDPRNLTPDPDACTEEEHTRWQADCDKWNKGEQNPTPSSCAMNEEPLTITDKKGAPRLCEPGSLLVTKSFYGLGINLDRNQLAMVEELEDLRQQCRLAATRGEA